MGQQQRRSPMTAQWSVLRRISEMASGVARSGVGVAQNEWDLVSATASQRMNQTSILRHLFTFRCVVCDDSNAFVSGYGLLCGRKPSQHVAPIGWCSRPPPNKPARGIQRLNKIIWINKSVNRIRLVPHSTLLSLNNRSASGGSHSALRFQTSGTDLVACSPCLLLSGRDQLHRSHVIKL